MSVYIRQGTGPDPARRESPHADRIADSALTNKKQVGQRSAKAPQVEETVQP